MVTLDRKVSAGQTRSPEERDQLDACLRPWRGQPLLQGAANELGFLAAGTKGAGDCLEEGCVLQGYPDFDAPDAAGGDPRAVTGDTGRQSRLRTRVFHDGMSIQVTLPDIEK